MVTMFAGTSDTGISISLLFPVQAVKVIAENNRVAVIFKYALDLFGLFILSSRENSNMF
jgi:hypothetical protein